MRTRVARRLHAVGIHLLCRRRWEPAPLLIASYTRPDGTTWEPDVDIAGGAREVHG